ncbi:FxLD family lanthipeptide [Streptomyces macrosporus]|uniref:FxLD family lantipeptide n=1 Tax=Streptomyces macrosporus TaxID=44032 RepID=A0ABP5XSP2_9ACTN
MDSTLDQPTTETTFDLDVQVVTDVPADSADIPCGTGDGCATTCASSCTSAV